MKYRMMMAGVALLALSAVPALAQTKPMKLTLNFLAGGPQAGFIYAKKLGLYEKAGINLTIEEGKGSATTAQMVATGQTDVGIADAPAAMQVRSKGAPLKIVAPVLQTNAFGIISLEESNIKTPKDLIGKRVAVQPGTAQSTLLDAIFAANNIDKSKVNIINVDSAALVGALLEKKIDVMLAGADFQSVQMRDRGFKIFDIFYRDVGVPTVGLSVVIRDDKIKSDADLYKKFIDVSLQGWDEARKNPEAASAAVAEMYPAANKDQILKQLQVDLKFLCAPGATALGKVPDANWKTTFDLLTQYLELPKDKPVTDYYTEELLPASGPKC